MRSRISRYRLALCLDNLFGFNVKLKTYLMKKTPVNINLQSGHSKVLKALALIIFLAMPLSAFAEKIGYVDARRLIDESPQGIAEIKRLEDGFSERSKALKGKFEQFKTKEADLQKNGVLMAADEREQKTEELREMQRELKRDQRDYNEEYNASRAKSLAGLQKIISDAVIFVAERDKYDLILQQAVFASRSIDLTDQVLEELVKRSKN